MNKEMFKKAERDILYTAKSFAILSVICAHMTYSYKYQFKSIVIADRLLKVFGQIGVICFFIIAGYLFSKNTKKNSEFWKRKLLTIILPWVFCGSLTYIISVVVDNRILSIKEYIKWILGIGTSLYFLSSLCILYLIFNVINNVKWVYLSILIGFLSNILTSMGILNNFLYTPYFNFLNWIAFFAIGIILGRKIATVNCEKYYKAKYFIIVIFIILIVISVMFPLNINAYWNILSIPIEISGFIVVIIISFRFYNNKMLNVIGKKSFSIYLIHMPIAGIINTRVPENTFFTILKPFIALLVIVILLEIIEYICKKIKCQKLLYLLGIR